MTVTVNHIPDTRVSADLLERWRSIPVAVIVDLDPTLRQLDAGLRPLRPAGAQPPLFGRAVTARCSPPDFGAVLHAIDILEPGDVLVIAAGGFADNAMIGDVLCGLLRGRGIAGVVVDGATRDVATLAGWDDFPVYTRAITPRGPDGYLQGDINLTVTVGRQQVHPGDLILGDDDGLVALSAAELQQWIEAAEARLVTEADWFSRLRGGESVRSVFGLAAPVEGTEP